MDVLLHRCVCVCVSQEGMEWMCCYTDVFVCVCVSGGNGMDVYEH